MSAAGANVTGALVGSLIGAVVGSAAWAAVGYFTGSEWGILAVGVGLAVGIGAAMGAKGRAGVPGGIVAALVTILAIVGARYALLQIRIERQIAESVQEYGDEIPGSEDDEYWVAFIADRIITEREQAGEDIDWSNIDDDEDWGPAGYPTDIWMEAQGTWSRLSLTEREEFCAAGRQMLLSGDAEDFRAFASVFGMLWYNLHPMALVIMGIAVSGAFGVAKNSRPLDESNHMEVDVTAQVSGQMTGPSTDHPSIATPAPSGFPSIPAAVQPKSQQVAMARPGSSSSASPTAPTPAKPTRHYKAAILDESQLPPQFRMKPPEDLPPIRVKRDDRDAA